MKASIPWLSRVRHQENVNNCCTKLAAQAEHYFTILKSLSDAEFEEEFIL